MDVKDFKSVVYEKDDETGIVTVTINRPDVKNALTPGVLVELPRAIDAVAQDETATAIIITGAKPEGESDPEKEAFCSGGYFNLAEVESMSQEMKDELDFTDIAQKRLCLKLWNLYKPVIVAMNGLAIGGGITIPIACADLIYASEYAWARLPFIKLGIIPELASSYLLPRLIGMQQTKEIMFFGEDIPAKKLEALGIVNKVLPHEELIPYAKEMTLKLVPPAGAYMAVRLTKEVLHKPLIEAVTKALDLENEALLKTFSSKDFVESMASRAEKRAPVFKGE
ncbi:MAG: enoyl-CoA hydratase/isomerase family protein [Deltaproteobacteria bacterium]|nr:enoyl-CoA hydratase/isomerase family protein [Deltaproteobacteria bacterium]MBW1813287.1 enoyl-CoA hydratase/isomerase family protein [Deltaproteobacteria bacterium]MBW1847363.1 enoyl-CoA hydratase/isomerase family protein [Deltaproteobacteria bacterium]MBW1984156.1 enoyl-CoA hydratase/isomerase family protein [Deltaproteobacteria bacterium]MBW2180786.1 enoyl-CoA hydratase/isomerase family protein [Deltaproteobacteria bacterium]